MPNWCENSIVVKHEDPNIIEKFVNAFNEDILCQAFRPEPDKLTHADPKYITDEQRDWRSENWGVKWDFGCGDGNQFSIEDSGTTEISIYFTTPWAPPLKLYEHMTDELGFDIQAVYWEEGMGILGKWSSDGDDEQIELPQTTDELEELRTSYPQIIDYLEEYVDNL